MTLTLADLRVDDFIIYGTPRNGIYVSKILKITPEYFRARDFIFSVGTYNLSNRHGWQFYGKARSLRTLQKRYPEYFI